MNPPIIIEDNADQAFLGEALWLSRENLKLRIAETEDLYEKVSLRVRLQRLQDFIRKLGIEVIVREPE